MDQQILQRAQEWMSDKFDKQTRDQVRYLLENNEKELIDAFYKNLEFGTGGLRGIMGVGTNRMNIYTVGIAAQALANYLKKNFERLDEIKVAIAHDCRNNSRLFAETVAKIMSSNDITVYLFDDLRPTPELSFAIRHLRCQGGVVITASHNPKEYNGFKAYWEDGAQVIAPHDQNIIKEADNVSIDQIDFNGKPEKIHIIGSDIDNLYIKHIKQISLSPHIIQKYNDIKIVYTPIHGTGVRLTPMALEALGFKNIIHVDEQDITDGNFPTVHSPNPENPEALEMAIEKAKQTGADLVMATDPDADRVGIAVRKPDGEFILLNGNQTAAILYYYVLLKWKENNKIKGNEFVVKTIVTTDLLKKIADDFGVEIFEVLTGFKYIAELIRKYENKRKFIIGGEESYGYLAADFVRDKDAVMSCALIAETAAWAKSEGKTLYDILSDIYLKYGLFKERLINIVKKGKEGSEQINKIMFHYRNNPPADIAGKKVVIIKDFLNKTSLNTLDNTEEYIDLPKSNVLQFILEDGTKISVRPSGTEPKIKFYISTNLPLNKKSELDEKLQSLDVFIDNIVKDFIERE